MHALLDLPAPAKLNLFLHVVGRRADGYHLLESVFTLIDWCDTIDLTIRADGLVSRSDEPAGLDLPADDLCVRAARLLQVEAGVKTGIHIHLRKQVPWGAGLGGGSSDAATVLIGLNRLWQLGWSRSRLAALGLRLGADVPFFIEGRTAWVSGIGEQMQAIDLPAADYVVLKPPVALPTSAVFTHPLLRRNTPPAIVADFLADPSGFGRNDLEAPATSLSPLISQGLALLHAHCGQARMSGSGSAVFAGSGDRHKQMSDNERSDMLQHLLATVPADWITRVCRSLPRHPLRDWLED
ncbi:MAG: hypothetical protein RL722_2813 [Pseudomonadota bacterium]